MTLDYQPCFSVQLKYMYQSCALSQGYVSLSPSENCQCRYMYVNMHTNIDNYCLKEKVSLVIKNKADTYFQLNREIGLLANPVP